MSSDYSVLPPGLLASGFFLFAETLRAWVGQLKDGRMSLVMSLLVGEAAVA
jgi:hypothetical protein